MFWTERLPTLLTPALAQLPPAITVTGSGEDRQSCTVDEMSASITASESNGLEKQSLHILLHLIGEERQRDLLQNNYKLYFCQWLSLCVQHTAYVCLIESKFPQLPNTVLVILLQHHDVDLISRCSVDNAITHNCAKSCTSKAFFCIRLPGCIIPMSAGNINHCII